MNVRSIKVTATDQETRRNARRHALNKMTKAQLIRLCQTGVTTPSGGCAIIEGGMYPLAQWSKGDIAASIMSAEFSPEVIPDA